MQGYSLNNRKIIGTVEVTYLKVSMFCSGTVYLATIISMKGLGPESFAA